MGWTLAGWLGQPPADADTQPLLAEVPDGGEPDLARPGTWPHVRSSCAERHRAGEAAASSRAACALTWHDLPPLMAAQARRGRGRLHPCDSAHDEAHAWDRFQGCAAEQSATLAAQSPYSAVLSEGAAPASACAQCCCAPPRERPGPQLEDVGGPALLTASTTAPAAAPGTWRLNMGEEAPGLAAPGHAKAPCLTVHPESPRSHLLAQRSPSSGSERSVCPPWRSSCDEASAGRRGRRPGPVHHDPRRAPASAGRRPGDGVESMRLLQQQQMQGALVAGMGRGCGAHAQPQMWVGMAPAGLHALPAPQLDAPRQASARGAEAVRSDGSQAVAQQAWCVLSSTAQAPGTGCTNLHACTELASLQLV